MSESLSLSRSRPLEFFLSSIQDPHNPRHCGQCLDGAFRACTDVDDSIGASLASDRNKAQKHNPDLWNAVVNFLFVKRSKKQMKRLLTRLIECTCRMGQQGGDVQRYHQLSVYHAGQLRTRIYNEVEHGREEHEYIRVWRPFLFNLVSSLEILISSSSKRLSAKGSSTSWPINLTDMVPHGPDAFVQSILQWYQTIPDPLFISLMTSVLYLSRELVIPSLAKFKFTKTVVESTRQLLDRVVADHLSGNSSEHMGYLLYRFPWQVKDAVYYLGTCTFVVFHNDFKETLHQDFEAKATQLCSLILYVIDALAACTPFGPAVRGQIDTNRLAILGEQLFRVYHMDRSAQHSFPVHPTVKNVPANFKFQPHTTAHSQVLGMLRGLRLDMRCSAVGCMNSLQTSGKDFQRCGRCELAAYCGRECQRKAWKDDEFPHKQICPIVVDMVQKAGGSALFADLCRSRNSDLESRGRLVQIVDTMKRNWQNSHIDDRDLMFVAGWMIEVEKGRGCASTQLYQKVLSPGFLDYDTVIARLSSMNGVPKPVYLDRFQPSYPFAEITEKLLKTLSDSESCST